MILADECEAALLKERSGAADDEPIPDVDVILMSHNSGSEEESGIEAIMILADECEAALLKERSGAADGEAIPDVDDVECAVERAIFALLQPHPNQGRSFNGENGESKAASWVAEEELALAINHREMGGNWTQLSAHLPGRGAIEVENFWKATLHSRCPTRILSFLWMYVNKVNSVAMYASRRRAAYEEAHSLFLSTQQRIRGSSALTTATLTASLNSEAFALSLGSARACTSFAGGARRPFPARLDLHEAGSRLLENIVRCSSSPLEVSEPRSGAASPGLKR
eukprot:gene24481-10089_t